jgi:hypothetical protein
MKGGESGVGTYRAYQADTVRVNQNRQRLRFKKKDLWTIHQMLWKTLWTRPLTPTLSQRGEGVGPAVLLHCPLSPLGRGSG